ncbi:MAG: hypothetical protein Q4A15_11770, partial [Prevotellaceae bacterium]|nr:hypothetical protein [Prevotellaceae bacterium]
MKRFLCLFFALVLAVSLVACGENNATNTDTTDNTNSTSESGESQTSEPNNTTKNEEDGFSNYSKLSGEKIYVNFSDKRHDDDGAYSKVFRKASITEMDIIAMFSDHVSVSDYKGVLDAFNDG